MRTLAAVFTLLVFTFGAVSADDFMATIKKVSGNKVTLNKGTKDKKQKDITLNSLDDVKVFQKFNVTFNDMDVIAIAPVQGGLKNKIFEKEVKANIKTDEKNNIIEIEILGAPIFPKDDN